ncbi:MAG: hypothetical protein QM756_01295 [Polyangiaceae bacterium]
MKRAARLATFALLLGVALAGPAVADVPDKSTAIQLDVSPSDSPLVPLLRAELGELGIETANDGALTAHVSFGGDSLEIRIVDDATGTTVGHEVFSVPGGRNMEPRAAALHAAEFLRWHLRWHDTATKNEPPAPSASVEPPKALPSRAEAPSDLRVSLLPIALFSPGGTSPGFGGELDLSRRFGFVGARLVGAMALLQNRLSVSEGSIDVSSGWGALEGFVILDHERSGTSFELAAGAALLDVNLRGSSSADAVGRDDELLTLAPLGDVRLRQRVTSGLALTLGSACLLPLRSTRLRVFEREVGRYGQALVTLGVGVDLKLF